MKLRDLERHLIAQGARKVAEGARHTKWRSADDTHATVVPRHTEIGPGLVRAICRQLEIRAPLTGREAYRAKATEPCGEVFGARHSAPSGSQPVAQPGSSLVWLGAHGGVGRRRPRTLGRMRR